MPVENYTNPTTAGHADPTWIRADGAFVAHPTFEVSDDGIVLAFNAGGIPNTIFGAVITVEENPQGGGGEMGWTDSDPDARSVRMESPLRDHLSTLPQAISLRRPFIAEWFSDATTSTGIASSADWVGYHAGPSGTPLHHINLSHDLTPAPGGPSSDLSDAPWRHINYYEGTPNETMVDPNISVEITDYVVTLTMDPDAGTGLSSDIRVKVTCENLDGTVTFKLLDVSIGRQYPSIPQPRVYSWTIDDIWRVGESVNIVPDGFVLRVYDDAYLYEYSSLPPQLMGTINPGWSAQVLRVYEYADTYSPGPRMEAVTMNHVVLLDFTLGGGGAT